MAYFSRKFIVACILLFASVLPIPAQTTAHKAPNKNLSGISALAVSCFSRIHYDGKSLDQKKAEQAFLQYLKTLDPGKYFLTQQDIDEFMAQKAKFASMFSSGKLELPFQVYNRVQDRYTLYADFAQRLLKKSPEELMNSDEVMLIDRKNCPWEKDVAALYPLWRKRIVNELIIATMADRSAREEYQKEKEKGTPEADLPELPTDTPAELILKRIRQVQRYYSENEAIDVLELFLNAVASAYDPHSSYMTPVSDEDFAVEMSLKLSGIGAVLTSVDGYTKIVEIITGGPADKDGRLQAGDRIVAVAQEGKKAEDVVNMSLTKVVRRIRGKAGTKVTLSVIQSKKGLNSVPVKIQLTRAEIIVKDREASGKVIESKNAAGETRKIGVLTLPSFYMDFDAARDGDPNYKRASLDVQNILEDFKKQNVDGVVMDLRNNGGGSLQDAVVLSGLFVKEGPVVQVRETARTESYDDTDGGKIAYDGPLVVMVDRLSASASEIFAAAIRDYGRGIIVGDAKTHGKGTVQTLSSLDNFIVFLLGKRIKAGSVKVTCAKFYRINGESTQLKGVTPDIVYPSFFDVMDLGEDKLDNPLPWDTIKAANFEPAPCKALLNQSIPVLRAASQERIGKNTDFMLLKENIDRFKKIREEKTVSLNLEKRWQKYIEEKKIADEQERIYNKAANSKRKKDKHKDEEKDIYLDETVNVLNDWIDITKKANAK